MASAVAGRRECGRGRECGCECGQAAHGGVDGWYGIIVEGVLVRAIRGIAGLFGVDGDIMQQVEGNGQERAWKKNPPSS